ncbi:MAG: protein kinase [Polyangiaceae bacterium]
MSFGPGSVIAGRYHADRLVGQGGMGEVWSGEKVSNHPSGAGERVALKRLLPAASKHHEVVARFRREAVLLGRIQSKYVARVIEFVDDREFGPVLVMEFIEGPSLAHILEDRKLLVEEAVDLCVDLAVALCDLHEAKVVHRDLKPGNIIMKPMPDGTTRAVIVDFGIGRQLTNKDNPDEITGITRANIALGTVEYMAPEQILNSRDVTPTTDIYAIGAILYRAVAGIHAFGTRRGEELARAKLIEDAPRLDSGRNDEIARGLADVVARCLKKRPAQRFGSAKELLDVIRKTQERVRIAEVDLDSTTEDGSDVRTAAVDTSKNLALAEARRAMQEADRAAAARRAAQLVPQDDAPPNTRRQPLPAVLPAAGRPADRAPDPAPPRTYSQPPQPRPSQAPRAPLASIPDGIGPPRPPQGIDPRASIPDTGEVARSAASESPRAPMPSIPDPRSSLPSIVGRDAGVSVDARSSIAEGRAPMASLSDIPQARPAKDPKPETTGVGVKTVALAVATAFAVGTALGLVLAPVASGGDRGPASSASASALVCPPAVTEKPSAAPPPSVAAAPPAGSSSSAPVASASAVASTAPSSKPASKTEAPWPKPATPATSQPTAPTKPVTPPATPQTSTQSPPPPATPNNL